MLIFFLNFFLENIGFSSHITFTNQISFLFFKNHNKELIKVWTFEKKKSINFLNVSFHKFEGQSIFKGDFHKLVIKNSIIFGNYILIL
jgi:hypothetical protein